VGVTTTRARSVRGERFSVRSSGMRIELLVYISFYVLLYSPETC